MHHHTVLRSPLRAALIALVAALAPLTHAQDIKTEQRDTTPESVRRALESRYLTDDERKDLRVRFGLWTDADLDTPARRARAAIIRGSFDDASLSDAAADPLDRAEAQLTTGRFAEALATIGDSQTMRAGRLRAEALLRSGKRDEAKAELAKMSERLARERLTNADELVEGVLAMNQLLRLAGPQGDAAGDFKALMALLGRARDELDRNSWSAHLAEAILLDDKDNPEEADDAVKKALALNPRCAEAMGLLAEMNVDRFGFDATEAIASEMEKLDEGSAFALLARARARLRQSDADGARELVSRVLKRYPDMPRARAMQAATEAIAFDFTKTDALLAEYDKLSPDTADALFDVGRVLSDARQYAEAAKYLELATKREPTWAAPFTELGLMEMQAGRDDRALLALERSTTLDPFNIRADNSLKLARELATFATVESDHFIIRYKPGIDEVLATEMPPLLEKLYRRVTGSEKGGIDHQPAFKTKIELLPDHRAFAVRIAGLPAIHTIAAATGPVIAMEAPREGPNHKVGPYDWMRVIQHEFAHTVTLSRTNNRLPHWFTEAAAQYLEDSPRDWNTVRLLARIVDTDTMFDFEAINIAFVRPKKPTDRQQAYAQGHWMYEYIVETYGPRAPLDLMDQYAAGVREPQAFEKVLGISREKLMEGFKPWARAQLVAWGMLPRDGVPKLTELLEAEKGDADQAPEPTPELIAKFLERYPDHADLLDLRVEHELKSRNGTPDAAMIPLLEKYAKARPVDPAPHRLLATIYLAGDAAERTKAIAHLEWLDAREQNSIAFAAELANRYTVAGDLDKAWAKVSRSVGLSPYDADPRELAATIAIKRKDYDAAERHIKALIKLEPDREIHKKRLEALARLRTSKP